MERFPRYNHPELETLELVDALDFHSFEAAHGSHEGFRDLYQMFATVGPDDGPCFSTDLDVLARLEPRELMAVYFAKSLMGDFNRNFGWDTEIGRHLTFDNEQVTGLFSSLGKAVQGYLRPDGQFGADDQIALNLQEAVSSYHNIFTVADHFYNSPIPTE